jgi:hypothetical protein
MKLENYLKDIERKKVPSQPPDGLTSGGWDFSFKGDDLMRMWEGRRACNEKGLWIVIDKIWTKRLAKWIGNRKCLEVMAGAGWLAKALSEHGVEIIATDNFSWDGQQHGDLVTVFDVEKIDAVDAVAKHSADILIVSWPPYDDQTICNVCDLWNVCEVMGEEKPVIYIGEGWGGCCAPDLFWEHYEYDDSLNFPMKSWHGIHDHVHVGHYRRAKVNDENDGELGGDKFAEESWDMVEKHGAMRSRLKDRLENFGWMVE